jgi:hypothetical protein
VGRYASEPEGKFEPAPSGTHVGICYRIIDIGTHHSDYQGQERARNQVIIGFELPNELIEEGKPFTVNAFYTNSLHEKAKMRTALEAWRGRPFTEDEAKKFDLVNLLKKPCMLSVGEKGKVTGIMALPKGTPIPKLTNDVFAFFLDEWDDALWAKVPDGIKELIKKSDEFKARLAGGPPPAVPVGEPGDPDDRIPF